MKAFLHSIVVVDDFRCISIGQMLRNVMEVLWLLKEQINEDELLKEGPGLCQIAFLLHDVHTVAVRRARNRIIVTKTLLWLVVCGENVVGRIDEVKGTIHELIGWLSLLVLKRPSILLHHSVPHRHTFLVTDSISDIDVVEWYRATRIERVARTFENNRRTYLLSCASQQGHIDTLNCRPSQSLFPSQNICFEWSGTEMPDASSNFFYH